MKRKDNKKKIVTSILFLALFISSGKMLMETQENKDLKDQVGNLEEENLTLSQELELKKSDLEKALEIVSQKNKELEQSELERNALLDEVNEMNLKIKGMNSPEIVRNTLESERNVLLVSNTGLEEVDDITDAFSFIVEEKNLSCKMRPRALGSNYTRDDYYLYYEKKSIPGFYKVITIDNVKYLVDSDDHQKVFLSGFRNLEEPFYLDSYGSYVLPFYDDFNRLYLVDLDTFEFILYGVDKFDFENYQHTYDDGFFSNGNLSDSQYRNWFLKNTLECEFYKQSDGSNGYVVELEKNGIKYLVDAHDFSKVLASHYAQVSWYTDKEGKCILKIIQQNGTMVIVSDESLVHTSDDLIRKREK